MLTFPLKPESRRLFFRFIAAMLLAAFCQSVIGSPVADAVQPMAILKGSTIAFSSGGDQYLTAFCMNQHIDAPKEGNPFNNYAGKVELTFKSGAKHIYDLNVPRERSDALKHFAIDGTGKHYALKFSRTDPQLENIAFLTTALAHTGTEDDFAKSRGELGTLEELATDVIVPTSSDDEWATKSRVYEHVQKSLWTYRISRVSGTSIHLDVRWLKPEQTASQQFINLDGRGDAILVRYGDLNLLIDTGLSTEAFHRIAAKLPKNIRLQLILTHRDQDHIGNVTRLLRAAAKAQVKIDNVITSSYEVPAFEKRADAPKVVKDLLQELSARKYERRDLSPQVAVFSAQKSVPIPAKDDVGIRTLLREAKEDMQKGGLLSKLLSSSGKARLLEWEDTSTITSFDLTLSPDVTVTLFQKTNPSSPNESSLITKLTHNGRSTLYTGDINEHVMEDLLAEESRWTNYRGLAQLQFTLRYLKRHRQNEFSHLTHAITQATSPSEAASSLASILTPLLKHDDRFRSQLRTAPYLFKADVLKWPHHAWLPKTMRGKQLLRQFIEAVSPDTLVFSVSPQSSEINFSPAEFADADLFIARLKSRRDPLSRWLVDNFSPSVRDLVGANNPDGVTRELKQQLAQELTRVLQGPLIYREDLFAGVDLNGMAPFSSTIAEAARPLINRELLERAYPTEIGAIRGQHVEKVKKYLQEYLPRQHFNIIVTARDHDIELRTKNCFKPQDGFGSGVDDLLVSRVPIAEVSNTLSLLPLRSQSLLTP